MTLRRYSSIKPSRGTVIPASVRAAVNARDKGCVGPRVGMPGDCFGGRELDHVHNSGLGKKGPSTLEGLVSLCGFHHRLRTENARTWRPILDRYLAKQ